ncbi:MBL fold metallo-hydrolase [Paraburkholderia susongensis]|uniref:Glyoxylase, beta-lactamase superfamily II n=1 Tax=Paraburkholderia susongensis TaxID=1515439 RepID=A0A1X7LQS1_9BURK|nr:MBL fold metallo-hydrolase [Paraburkholderia susongensis]SMG56241.1 Glyoxylase, beta-lactamase superfamily II [Paraburkholderia susongensis]
MTPRIEAFYDTATCTFTYVVYAQEGSACAVIDPVLDYDPKSGCTSTASAQRVIAFVREHRLRVTWLLETHAHADHLSAAPYLKEALGGRIAIGASIRTVQNTFRRIFNLGEDLPVDGRQFDHLFVPGERFEIGEVGEAGDVGDGLSGEALHVPGHTPADMAYRIGDAVFVGDTLFMPDLGSARCDFPGGDARTMYESVRTLLELPPDTRLCMCHDYPPSSRAARWQTTVAEQRRDNIHLRDGVSADEFVAMRTARDRTLGMPTLILPAIQINIRAGAWPEPEDNGVRYLKIPLNAF